MGKTKRGEQFKSGMVNYGNLTKKLSNRTDTCPLALSKILVTVWIIFFEEIEDWSRLENEWNRESRNQCVLIFKVIFTIKKSREVSGSYKGDRNYKCLFYFSVFRGDSTCLYAFGSWEMEKKIDKLGEEGLSEGEDKKG